ncbi:MAG: thioredoxin-like domain-containing protein [Bacteroidota bacterium]
MRIFSFLGLLLLCWSCSDQSATSSTATASPSTVQASKASTVAVTNNNATDEPVGPAKIEVEVSGMEDGRVLLVGFYETEQYRADTATMRQGKATFRREEGYKQGFYIISLPNRNTLQILVGADQQFKITSIADDLVMGTQISGSQNNELLYENLKFQENLNPRFLAVSNDLKTAQAGTPEYDQFKKEQDQLTAERNNHLNSLYNEAPNSLFTSFKRAGQNPDLKDFRLKDGSPDEVAQIQAYKIEFWDNVDFSDERLLRSPVIINKLKRYMTQLTPQNPDSITTSADRLIAKVEGKYPKYFKFFANWVALQYQPTKTTLMDAEAVMVHMVQNYFTEEKAFWAQPGEVQGLQQRAAEMQASLVNKKGPDVISTDPNGQTRSIYEMDNDYIVVYMYNPECEHCQEETPILRDFSIRYKDKVGVFAIAIDTDDTKWRNYIQKAGIQNWTNVYDPTNRSIYAKYFVDKTPELYLLNKDKVIIGKNLKTFQAEELIKREEG